MPKQPLSTYRVQLHAGFTLRDLLAQLDYLHRLGVDWIYASPVLAAEPGSQHGYDAVDVTKLNPELGSEADWSALHTRRRALGMGWLQDIVPNHVGYSLTNPWIREVLKHGEASAVARHFDIDWRHPDFQGKLMLPILGAPLGEVIDAGQISVDAEKRVLRVYGQEFPLSARSLAMLPGPDAEPELAEVLEAQHYRLAYWKETETRINYRRFFTVNGLIALRVERPDTFAATHAKILAWVKAGDIDGLRVDHVDGLTDPLGYLRRLREAVGPEAYVIVEKILEPGERLPEEWPVQGTSGYDFLAQTNQLLRDYRDDDQVTAVADSFGAGLPSFSESDSPDSYEALVLRNKRYILETRMAGELDNVLHHARGALAGLPLGMDRELLRGTLADWLAAFPVYRAYPRRGRVAEAERRVLLHGVEVALAGAPTHPDGLRSLGSWLRSITQLDERSATFLQRAMQLSGPLMAKGLEDTTFYQYQRYLANNEVGDVADPAYRLDVPAYHDALAAKPLTDLNASSTHDTKRGEDARARLHAISGHPEAWAAFAKTARACVRRYELAVPEDVVYMLLQTLFASYPQEASGQRDFGGRMHAYAEKALREGKLYSSWAAPDEAVETSVHALIDELLSDDTLLDALAGVEQELRPAAWLNSLRTVFLKCTAPGAPDIYQGTEFFDRSMVDPDNRRPVDYALRAQALARVADADLREPTAPNKLAALHRLLVARREHADLFREGSYVPLAVENDPNGTVLAFRRVFGDASALVVCSTRTPASEAWPLGDHYGAASLSVPELGSCRGVLGGIELSLGGEVQLRDLLDEVPFEVYLPRR